jgi:predicted RNA methylase
MSTVPPRDNMISVYLPAEVLRIQLDAHLMGVLNEFLSVLDGFLPWADFGKVPVSHSRGGTYRLYRDLYRVLVRHQNISLSASPAQTFLRNRLVRKRGVKSFLLFKFLCQNFEIAPKELEGIIDEEGIKRYEKEGLFIRREGKIVFPFTLVPYNDHCYLADSLHLREHPERYPVWPAHVSAVTFHLLEYLKRQLKNHHVSRMLEMGSGTGIVSLEMRGLVAQREGAEIDDRNLVFSEANKILRGHSDVDFYGSDLFSSVKGKFDLIVFNPWQPAERSWDVIQRFLKEAGSFLTESGSIVLVFSSKCMNGHDSLLDELSEVLKSLSFTARRELLSTAFYTSQEGSKGVEWSGFLWITRCNKDQAGEVKQPIRTSWNFRRVVLGGRRLLNGAVTRMSRRGSVLRNR